MKKVKETPEFYFEDLEKEHQTGDHGAIYSTLKATSDAANAGRIGALCSAFSLLLALLLRDRVDWRTAASLAVAAVLLAYASRWGRIATVKTRLGKHISGYGALTVLLASFTAAFLSLVLVLSLILNAAAADFGWREKLVKIFAGVACCCAAAVAYSLASVIDFKQTLQRGAVYVGSAFMVFSGFGVIAYSDHNDPSKWLTNSLNMLGYVLIVQATMNVLTCYFMVKRSVWTMFFTSIALLFALTGTSSILMSQIYASSFGQSSSGTTTTIHTKFVDSSLAKNCIAKLIEKPTLQPDLVCQTSLLESSTAPAKHLLVWCLAGLFSTLFASTMLYRQARERKARLRLSLFRVGVVDVAMTLLFVAAFLAGYAFLSKVEDGNSQVVAVSSHLLQTSQPLAAHNQQTVSQVITSSNVVSPDGKFQQISTSTNYSSSNLANNTVLEKKIVKQISNDSAHGYSEIITEEDKYTYPNKSIITYKTVTNNTTPPNGAPGTTTSKNMIVVNPDGTTNTYNLDSLTRRRRMLMENRVYPRHLQGSTGGNFIWISCFTGFGTASLININTILDTQPLMDNCKTRINAERPDYTVEKLRERYNQYVQQFPNSA